jgi:aspartyl-tRNA(Asn)/glutamyl-tRNA(Gln) amidotransferase subunit C
MSLAAEQVRWVAHLARLALPPEELALLGTQLSTIVAFVDQLQQVDTSGIEPLAHALDVRDVFRLDEVRPSLPVEAALANAPARKRDFYSVPAVLD